MSVVSMPRGGGLPRGAARDAVARARGVLVDWDGCIAVNDRPAPAALRFLAAQERRVAIVSNNSTHLPEDFVRILAREGVRVSARKVFLAGAEALRRARELGASRVMILGDSRMKAHARGQGLNIVTQEASLVVLMRDRRFSYAKLERAANCLRAGAKLIVSNPDLTHPGLDGRIVPETGALLAALKACLGSEPEDMEIIGKPSQRLLVKACQALGVRPEEAIVIGDNPATDGAGADGLGAPWVMVGGRSEIGFDHLLPPRPKTAGAR